MSSKDTTASLFVSWCAVNAPATKPTEVAAILLRLCAQALLGRACGRARATRRKDARIIVARLLCFATSTALFFRQTTAPSVECVFARSLC
jgi:hypothetical protein